MRLRQIRGRAVRGQGDAGEGSRRVGRAVPPWKCQGRVWAHLGRVGGAQLSEVPDSGLLRVRGSPERSGWPGSSVDRSPHWRGGLSGRGTARERARSQLAPKIPNRPRGPAQERLLPRRLSETAYQRSPICRGSAPNVRACASPIPPRLLRGALAQARSHLGADSERGWLRRVPEGLRHHAESEPAPGALPPGSQDTEGPSDTDRAPHPSPGTHGPRWSALVFASIKGRVTAFRPGGRCSPKRRSLGA